ncbi:hypothetical protein D0Z07_8396, partial [Hyphodiscus hymeniophilus]
MASASPVGLMPAPEGVTPDFNIHHMTETQLSFILAYGITLGLAIISLGLRFQTRIFIMHAFGLDDGMCAGGSIHNEVMNTDCFSIAFFCISIQLMKYGFGRHLWEVTAAQLGNYLKLLSPLVATYAWAPAFTKLSLLVLLHRLNPKFWFRMALYATAFMIIGYTLSITLTIAYPCSPLKANTGDCLNNCGLWQAILNIITDFIILVLPLHMLYKLNLPLRQKLVVGSIFSTGIFVIAICIVRITYIMSLQNNPDVTYSQGRAAVWSSVELNIGILCNAVIVLKPFFRQFFPRMFSSYAQKAATDTTGNPDPGGRFSKLSKEGAINPTLPLSVLKSQHGAESVASGPAKDGEPSVTEDPRDISTDDL